MISINNIYSANFDFDQPFKLNFADGEVLYAEKVVRMIPRRRLVAFGIWRNKPVVAKLFFDARRAKKQVAKELLGIKILQENKVPTPALLSQGTSEDKRCQVLVFERIFATHHIEDWCTSKRKLQDVMPQLRMVMVELATQHVLGIVQKDLHLKNYLVTEKIVYTLDAAQIKLLPKMLQGKACLNYLALFLSQLGIGSETYQEELFRHYAKVRGWVIKKDDLQVLFSIIRKWDQARWHSYKKKIFRESSNFSSHQDWTTKCVYDRAYAGAEFLTLIENPETAYQHANAKILKAGRSATVIMLQLDQRQFVVKRYNMKNIFHFLRRCFRPTRAHVSWQLAQKLKLFRFPTAAPVAFVEKRYLGLRGKSYYIMEYVEGEHLNDFFTRHDMESKAKQAMVKRVVSLLKNLSLLGITHGDLKTTNILIDRDANPLLIDLDGALMHRSPASLRKARDKEITRFLENFSEQSSTHRAFKEELI